MGQVLFDPPSVGGWSQNAYWLSTAAALARWQFAQMLAAVADLSAVADTPRRISGRRRRLPALDAAAGRRRTASALTKCRRRSGQLLTVLALVSPEYVSN